MKILTSLENLEQGFGPSIVTLGNFDGVHLGHRELFRVVLKKARQSGFFSVVCTFNPHPLKMFSKKNKDFLLNTIEEKRRLIAASHIDYLFEIPFTDEFAKLSPEQFIDSVLVHKLNVRELVVGYDYSFGKARAGNAEFLKEYGKKVGFDVDIMRPIGIDGQPYGSTQIRNLICSGNVSRVVAFLGRHYNLEGFVTTGFQRGRKIGFPTANLQTEKELLPALGVYAVKVRFDNHEYDGVVNIGTRPTFPEGTVSIEVHLLDFSGDLYGKKLRVYFVERLREEKKYSNSEFLAHAITEDILKARRILSATRIIQYHEYLSLK